MWNKFLARIFIQYIKWMWVVVLSIFVLTVLFSFYYIHPVITPCVLIIASILGMFLVIFDKELLRALLMEKFKVCPYCGNTLSYFVVGVGSPYVTCTNCNLKV